LITADRPSETVCKRLAQPIRSASQLLTCPKWPRKAARFRRRP
jgi:hypothetical protein